MSIKNNTTSLQNLLDMVNALPGAEGIKLPELTNEGAASDLLSGKQLINSEGNKVTGTFSIDSELNTQDNLISQIQSALIGKSSGVTLPTLSNPATSDELMYGYELIDEDGNIVVGTHVCSIMDEEYGYVYLEHNLPEEYEIMVANGVICPCGTSTKVPLDLAGFISFYFPCYEFVENIYCEYLVEGDDGDYLETMACNFSPEPSGGPFISGLCFEGNSSTDGHIKIIITFEEV